MMIGGWVEQFLGLSVERIQEGDKYCCKFNQPGLINNIFEDTGIKKCNAKGTPTLCELPLGLELRLKLTEENSE
eukprot:15328227-Ditylum_brightwellii.AAC.2